MRKSIFAKSALGLFAASAVCTPITATAGAELSAGVWWVYQNVTNSDFNSASFSEDLDNETGGNFADPALILYADDDGSHGPWHFSAETRIGTGSFTSAANNNSGDNFTVHKAWIGYDLTEDASLKLGKSQVPFGWKTVNFWPGDGLQGGYGDQMDVGLKLSGDAGAIHYDAAYYHQDDWGEDSTDTVDDNGHWGSTTTYRKVQTLVGNLSYALNDYVQVGVSAQSGGLQELISDTGEVSGDHSAAALYYTASYDGFWGKVSAITTERNLPEEYLDATIENTRYAAELGYSTGNWSFYTDLTYAEPGTDGNDTKTIRAFAPGLSYDYGPGWMYLEYLTQDGYVDRNGMALEGDFDALYATIDFYF